MNQHISVEQSLQKGRNFILEGKPHQAYSIFYHAIDRLRTQDSEELPSELLSFYGLTVAMVGGSRKEGLRLCQKAVETELPKAEFFLNLGKVYCLCKQKQKAFNAYKQGLKINPGHPEILSEINCLGERRTPFFNLLPRKHFLNQCSGILLDRHLKTFLVKIHSKIKSFKNGIGFSFI